MPNSFNDINATSTLIAIAFGVWGSILSFFKRDTKGFKLRKKIFMFFMDMFVNIGITILVYLGLIGYGLNEILSVAISGFIGHQGTRVFYLVELIILEKLGADKTFNKIS